MKGMVWKAACAAVALAVAGLPASHARADLAGCDLPKVDGFVVFVDQSGSMYEPHGEAGDPSALLAKRILLQLNEEVPSQFCCMSSALYLFAPFEEVKPPYLHDEASFATRIGWIPDSQPVALRLTPMADGFEALTPVVTEMKGKTAVIVVTDGESNTGGDPVEAARALVAAKPGTCLHVVSLADSDRGREINAALAQVTPECRSVEGLEIMNNGPKVQQFARDVFCKSRPPAVRRGG